MAVIKDGTCNLTRHHFETNRQVKKNDIKSMFERMQQADFQKQNWDESKRLQILKKRHLRTSVF